MFSMCAHPSQCSPLMTTDKGLLQQVEKTVGASKETVCVMEMLQGNAQTQQLSEKPQNQAHEK